MASTLSLLLKRSSPAPAAPSGQPVHCDQEQVREKISAIRTRLSGFERQGPFLTPADRVAYFRELRAEVLDLAAQPGTACAELEILKQDVERTAFRPTSVVSPLEWYYQLLSSATVSLSRLRSAFEAFSPQEKKSFAKFLVARFGQAVIALQDETMDPTQIKRAIENSETGYLTQKFQKLSPENQERIRSYMAEVPREIVGAL